MIFSANENRKQLKPKLIQLTQEVSFFAFTGGVLGVIFGGSSGMIKGIPLRKILPQSMFKSVAFFTSISAINGTLEIVRNQKDAFNPIIAGGWTGFIFGHGITKNIRNGLSLGLQGALLTWAIDSFTIPGIYKYFKNSFDALNPILMEESTRLFRERIDDLQKEIQDLRKSK